MEYFMRKDIIDKVLGLIFEISLKARVMKEWQISHAVRKPDLSERHMLILELAKDFAPITEKELGKIFSLPASSISDLVKKLENDDLIEKVRPEGGDARERHISLSEKGEQKLKEMKQSSYLRYQYLIDRFQEKELETFIVYLENINKTADSSMKNLIFLQY
jgi:DNA-binding MarR family transcriptional regulator